MIRSAAEKAPNVESKLTAPGHCAAVAPSTERSSGAPGNEPGALKAIAPPRVVVKRTLGAPADCPLEPGTAAGSDQGGAACAAEGMTSAATRAAAPRDLGRVIPPQLGPVDEDSVHLGGPHRPPQQLGTLKSVLCV